MPRKIVLLRFVRALIAGSAAIRNGDAYATSGGGVSAPAELVLELVGSGALEGDAHYCRANAATRGWLKRACLDADAFAAQHREVRLSPGGAQINLLESPLARLAVRTGAGEAFLDAHHLEVGERVRRLVERAHLLPRVTMSYATPRVAGGSRQAASEISDLAADARREIARIHRLLPRDCADVVIDVCGMLRGLQQVEQERRWPRRSAKLVLRIGLEQLAQHYGLGPFAQGRANGTLRTWVDEGARPHTFSGG